MIDAAVIEQRMRGANPIPTVADIDDDELALAIAAADTRRAAVMQAPTQHPTPTTPVTPTLPRRRRAWAFAAAFILVIAAIGIAALVVRNAPAPPSDQPAPPDTEVPQIESLRWTYVQLSPGVEDVIVGGPGLIAIGHNQVWTSSEV